jgi:multiple sugar transport system ATP-binding protein
MGRVSLRGIHKTYGEVPVIAGVDLEVQEGEFLVFVGPSGCGKSTMLRMIAGLESITAGELLIDGVRANEIRAAERGAAMVFQSYALYPHMTVAENMGFALKMAGVSKQEREAQVSRTAEALRISELLKRFPKELSGGQRQRVAIGRAIVRKPKVFLFDEPLSNLDAALRVDMRIELSRLHKELGTTMIYVTHDQVEAMTMGSRIAVFNKGCIEQLGSPMELYNKPETEFVATFLGTPRINLVAKPDDVCSDSHRAFWQKLVPSNIAGVARAGLRAEHVAIVAAADGIPATVVLAEHLGDASVLHVRIDGLEDLIHAKTGADQAHLVAGDSVGLRPAAERAIYFDSTSRRID